jgi:hypothetical protein
MYKDVSYIIVINYKAYTSEGIKESIRQQLCVDGRIVYLGNNMFGSDSPVYSVMLTKSLTVTIPKVSEYIEDINLMRVSDIGDLKEVLL